MKPASTLVVPMQNVAMTKEQMEDANEQTQAAITAAASAERARADKISTLLGNANYLITARPSQVLPRYVLTAMTQEQLAELGELNKQWYFSRFYHTLGIVVDLFETNADYNSSNVPGRREWCEKHGLKYAALGPGDKLSSLPEQLDL